MPPTFKFYLDAWLYARRHPAFDRYRIVKTSYSEYQLVPDAPNPF